jgi:hypothetical protein
MNTLSTSIRRVALTMVISTQVLSTLIGAELPQVVRTLMEKRQEAISRIDNVFVQELEKIKVNYTKGGDLESANMVAELINQTKERDRGFSPDGDDALISLESKLVGRWLIYDTDQPKVWTGVITIAKDLTYTCDGTFGADGHRKGNVVKTKEKNKILIGPYEFNISNISSGKILTRNVGPRTMERIK